jgi:hypothetical protein
MLMSSRSARRRGFGAFGIALALVLGAAPRPAWAQDQSAEEADLTKARALFQRGIELEQAGNWSAAVQTFREVGQVRMTPQVRFHIALCEERLGRLVAALGGYELALAEADSVGGDFRSEVETNVNRLRESIPRIVIERGTGAEAATIELDGVVLGDSSVGVEVPLDPGPHAVTARAPGYRTLEKTVTVAENSREVVAIELEPLPKDELLAAGGGGAVQTQPIPKVVPYVIGGVGAASLIASGVFFSLRQNALSDLESGCPNHTCPAGDPSLRDKNDSMRTYHYGALITLGTGVALVGTAVVLYALDPRIPEKTTAKGPPRKPRGQAHFVPQLGPKTAGGTLLVSF